RHRLNFPLDAGLLMDSTRLRQPLPARALRLATLFFWMALAAFLGDFLEACLAAFLAGDLGFLAPERLPAAAIGATALGVSALLLAALRAAFSPTFPGVFLDPSPGRPAARRLSIALATSWIGAMPSTVCNVLCQR